MEGKSAFKTSKPTGKRHLARPRNKWKDNIRINPKEIGVSMRNCIEEIRIEIFEELL